MNSTDTSRPSFRRSAASWRRVPDHGRSVIGSVSRPSSSRRSPRVTIPTRTPWSTTGSRPIRRLSISAYASVMRSVGATVSTSRIITSRTGRYGGWPTRSLSVTIPTMAPPSSTGNPPMPWSVRRRTTAVTVSRGAAGPTRVHAVIVPFGTHHAPLRPHARVGGAKQFGQLLVIEAVQPAAMAVGHDHHVSCIVRKPVHDDKTLLAARHDQGATLVRFGQSRAEDAATGLFGLDVLQAPGGPDLLHRPECPAGAFCPRRARCLSASRAAACSACFLLDPLPSPRMRPLASTVATKILAWSGPSWLLIRYLGMRRSRSCSSSCNVLL